MVFVLATVITPLNLLRHMRALERVAGGALILLLGLLMVLVAHAARNGVPALMKEPHPQMLWSTGGAAPQAFVVIGFGFYMQPCLLPLLHELGGGGGYDGGTSSDRRLRGAAAAVVADATRGG